MPAGLMHEISTLHLLCLIAHSLLYDTPFLAYLYSRLYSRCSKVIKLHQSVAVNVICPDAEVFIEPIRHMAARKLRL